MSTFYHSREFPTDISNVYDAIRSPKRLANWWGPEGFSNTFHVFEFHPEGKWIYTMHGPDGKDYSNESVFVETVENSSVLIRHISLPAYELNISLQTTESGTLLTWTCKFENANFAEKMRDFLEQANEQNLDRLENELRGDEA